MSMSKYLFLSIFVSAVAISGCGKQKSAMLVNPPHKSKSFTQSGGYPEFDLAPKAEIVFVIDDSASMKDHITRVSENINQFVDTFSRNNPLEYHLAVTSVYDFRRFTKAEYQEKYANDPKFFDLAQFHPVKKSETEVIENKFFISSQDDDLNNLLKNTLKIDIHELGTGGTVGMGPENEELFSPVAEIYGVGAKHASPKAMKTHAGFSMGPDSYKIIFFVTDANDASLISASELYGNLIASSNGDSSKVLAFGAIIPKGENCKADPSGARAKAFFKLLGNFKNSGVVTNFKIC